MKIVKNNGPTLQTTCGDCLHFKDIAHHKYREVCSKLSVREFAKPCEVFAMNWKLYNYNEEFANILKATETENLPKLVALVNGEIHTRRAKFKFGQPVYVRLFGDDFISNYVKCFVISAQGRYVYVQGTRHNYYGAFVKRSVFTEAQFLKKLKELAILKKFTDPKLKQYTDWKPLKRGEINIKEIPIVDEVWNKKNVMTFSVNEYE